MKPDKIFHVRRAGSHPIIMGTVLLIFISLFAAPVWATPTQSDVFKSIQDSVGESHESASGAVPWVCAGVGVIIILALFSRRQTRQAMPKVLNSPNRLLREIMRSISLKPRELKQLKLITDETGIAEGQVMASPLILLLCPSLVAKTAQRRDSRTDRRMLAQLLKKFETR